MINGHAGMNGYGQTADTKAPAEQGYGVLAFPGTPSYAVVPTLETCDNIARCCLHAHPVWPMAPAHIGVTAQRIKSKTMPTPFPGMDPYLEQPTLWPDVHNGLIAELRNALAPQLRPRYYVALEERTYLAAPTGLTFVSRPDVTVADAATSAAHQAPLVDKLLTGVATLEPVIVELPIPELVRETYLEVRLAQTHTVITVLELLSPANKRPGEGRQQYERKRLHVLATSTHLVEIDLLRAGEPMPMSTRGQDVTSDYRLLISRAEHRPCAVLLTFTVRDPIPSFRLPLQPGDPEPLVDLNHVLHALYDRAGYDLRLDSQPRPGRIGRINGLLAPPPWTETVQK